MLHQRVYQIGGYVLVARSENRLNQRSFIPIKKDLTPLESSENNLIKRHSLKNVVVGQLHELALNVFGVGLEKLSQ